MPHTHPHTSTHTHPPTLAHPHFHAYNVRAYTHIHSHATTDPHTHIHPLSLTLTSILSRGGIHECFETNKVPLCGRTSFVQGSGSVCRSTPSSVPRSACTMPFLCVVFRHTVCTNSKKRKEFVFVSFIITANPSQCMGEAYNPVYARRVTSLVLVCSLSSHRHSYTSYL